MCPDSEVTLSGPQSDEVKEEVPTNESKRQLLLENHKRAARGI